MKLRNIILLLMCLLARCKLLYQPYSNKWYELRSGVVYDHDIK